MIRPASSYRSAILLLLAAGLSGAAIQASTQDTKPTKAGAPSPTTSVTPVVPAVNYGRAIENLVWRSIGPAIMGGRIDDFAVVESDPRIVYVGTASGGIFKTSNAGTTWEPIFDNEAVSTIGDLALAPSDPGIVWAGTGESNNRQSSSWGNGVYKSLDGGRTETWRNIRGGLPQNNGVANVIREHPRNPDLLFVGTEYGAYASWDHGSNWTRLKMNLPTVPVDDILIHPRDNDLIFGTHGRSIWILDDITPLEQLNGKVLNSDLHLFDARPAIAWRIWNHKGSTGHKAFVAPNPPYGAMIHFYLKSKLDDKERVRLTVLDKGGTTVRELTCGGPAPAAPSGGAGPGFGFGGFGPQHCDAKAGINRVAWDLRQGMPVEVSQDQQQQFGFFGPPRGPLVDPGEYTVKIAVVPAPGEGGGAGQTAGAGWEASKPLKVEEDPRVTISAADRAARRQTLNQLVPLAGNAISAQRSIMGLRTNLNNVMESWKRPGAPSVPDDVKKSAEALLKKIDEVYPRFAALPTESGALGAAGPPQLVRPTPLPQRIGRLLSALDGFTAAPTATQLEELRVVSGLLQTAAAQVRKLADEDLPSFNKMMRDAGVPYVNAPSAPR